MELQFTNGSRFFSSGHGEYQGVHIVADRKDYGPLWDSVVVPTTPEQEGAIQRASSDLVGLPFDWKCMIQFMLPWNSCRKPKYCSAIILEVLQTGLHMFPAVGLKISPNGLYRIFLSCHSTLIYSVVPDDAIEKYEKNVPEALASLLSTASASSMQPLRVDTREEKLSKGRDVVA